ncbi:phospholipid carrier-dependent glycosyltransferase [Actinoplanes sp. RD1]|uniref:phospholipid carrier-dependent glycosyltransferase n=1 Tax=Actinoplanes sp. RD1 TaxID=3064538 RepID=UPI002740DC4B|nr:phospholipid carrier-dependent glycosyltransferase [Actinoplanes sp. RD1]
MSLLDVRAPGDNGDAGQAAASLSPGRSRWAYASIMVVAAAVYLVNLDQALDFDLDEVMYSLAGQNVAASGSVSWGAEPVSVHPPMHFLLVGLWTLVTGTAHGPIIDALYAARLLGAVFSILTVAMTGLLARRFTTDSRLIAAAMGLVALDGFLVRFGRTALIEPTAVLAGVVVVYLAVRLRTASEPRYVVVVGLASGVALLVKEPLLFTVLVPVAAAVLEHDGRQVRRSAAAVLVGLLVWGVFPLWAVTGGAGAWWLSEHDISLRRISGLLQVSGLNRPGVSSTGVFGDTFVTYAGGYLIFALGAAGLLALAYRGGLFHRRRLAAGPATLVAFGLLSYAFLAYCVVLGQANEQLTAYSAVPAVLLTVLAWGSRPPKALVAAWLIAALVGVATWTFTVALARDDATARMGRYLTANAACAPVNATGNALRWAPVLSRNHVEAYRDGDTAVAAGVRLFLLSPKDSRMRYGTSSPELDAFVRSHGAPVVAFASRRYERIELWQVSGPIRGEAAVTCGNSRPPVSSQASAPSFLMLFGAVLLLGATASTGARAARRRAS